MQRHAVWQWVGADDGAPWWSGGRKMGGKLCKGNANGRRPTIGGRALSTRQTHSSRVPEWQMANAPTVSFVRRFWRGILDPWSSLAMTTDGSVVLAQGQKRTNGNFSNYCRRQQQHRRQQNTHTNKNKKGTFNALKCDYAHISFMVPFRHRDSPNHQ